ncbi:MAG: biotin--[acetyl-CoA-carboxylase] ligase [Acidobacteria bacterium]|nr:biotin--[acetyl-CoA-carboxylase] ligase [Acidobacteriota bacterium]
MTSRLRRAQTGEPTVAPPDGSVPYDEPLTPSALHRRLRTAHMGHRIYHYPEIGSTNDRAIELAAAGEPEGSIVIAERQTRGRGRRDRTWISADRLGLYLSMILRPGGEVSNAPLFTLLGSVATARALSSACGCVARIKWPNDVIVKGRKIAGILGEVRSSAPTLKELVLGIGINVNHEAADFPSELGDRATSVYLETGRRHDRCALLVEILERFERCYLAVLRNGPEELLSAWRQLSAIPPGTRVSLRVGDELIEGILIDIESDGALRLQVGVGSTRRVAFGEIEATRGPAEADHA